MLERHASRLELAVECIELLQESCMGGRARSCESSLDYSR